MTNPTIAVPVELLERAALMELDTTKRSIAIQDELRALLTALPADHSEQLPPLIQCLRENGQQIAERAFDAQEGKYPQVGRVPAGCQLVPIQPTEEMRRRAQDYLAAEGMIVSEWLIHTSYTEMLAAAPKAPEGREDAKDAERYRWLRDHFHGFEHYRSMKHRPNAFAEEIDAQIVALSAAQAGGSGQ